MPFGLSANVQQIKRIAMAVTATIVVLTIVCSIAPIFSYYYLQRAQQYGLPPREADISLSGPTELYQYPEHPFMQYNLDRYQEWINYGDVFPDMRTFTGLQTKNASAAGWVNPYNANKDRILSPHVIIDYHGCLSRPLYTTNIQNPGYHVRLSLCRHRPYMRRFGEGQGRFDEAITVDIRPFLVDSNGDLHHAGQGLSIPFDTYVSLVKQFKWVESYNHQYDNRQPQTVYTNINRTAPDASVYYVLGQPASLDYSDTVEEFEDDIPPNATRIQVPPIGSTIY